MIFDHDKTGIEVDARKVVQFIDHEVPTDIGNFGPFSFNCQYGDHTAFIKGSTIARITMVVTYPSGREETYSVYRNPDYISVLYTSTLNGYKSPSYYGFPVRYVVTLRNDSNHTLFKIKEYQMLGANTLYTQWFKKEGITEPTVTDWIRYSLETGNDI